MFHVSVEQNQPKSSCAFLPRAAYHLRMEFYAGQFLRVNWQYWNTMNIQQKRFITICIQPVSVQNFSRLFTFQTSCFSSETRTFQAGNCYVVYKNFSRLRRNLNRFRSCESRVCTFLRHVLYTVFFTNHSC